jgi:hypothetical protein
MNASQAKIGFERKIGYSFVGLMARNAVSLLAVLSIALLSVLNAFAAIRQLWKLDVEGALGLSLAILVVSMLCWVVVGLPVVLLFCAEIVSGFHRMIATLIGAALGTSAFLLFLAVLLRSRLEIADFRNPEALGFFLVAALVGGVASAVYCALVKGAMRRQAKENGAPSGAPRSLPWFDA